MQFSQKQIERLLFSLLILLLPTQLGKHFWPAFAYVDGIRVDYLAPTLYVTDVLIVGLFLCWLGRIQVFRFPIRNLHRSPLFWYLLFLVFVVSSILFSSLPSSGWYQLLKFLAYSFFFLYVAQTVSSAQQIRTIACLLSFGVVAESLIAFAQYLQQSSLGGAFYWFGERTFTATTPGIANASLSGELILRPYGTFSHPNVLAGYLVLSLVFILFIFVTTRMKKRVRWWLGLSLLIGTNGLLLTMSRTANIIWFLSFCLIIGFHWITYRSIKLWHGVLGMVFFVGSVFFAHPFLIRIAESQLTESSVTSRMKLANDALSLLLQHPFLGVGPGSSIQTISSMQTVFSPSLFLQPVHNIFLFIGVELGFGGLIFFVSFLVLTYRRLLQHFQSPAKNRPYSLLCMVLLTSILLLGMVDHYWVTLQQGQLFFALVLGLSWSQLFR